MKEDMRTVTVMVRMPEYLRSELDALASHFGLNRSEYLRRTIAIEHQCMYNALTDNGKNL